MTKRDLVVEISRESGITQADVAKIVQLTLDGLAAGLVRGETIELRNFGVFDVKKRKSRIGRNPNNPRQDVTIPERAVVRFRAGKGLRKSVEKQQSC